MSYSVTGLACVVEGYDCSISDVSCVDDSARNPTENCPKETAACNGDADCKDCAALLSDPPDACKDGASLTCDGGRNPWCCYFEDHTACLKNKDMANLLGALAMR